MSFQAEADAWRVAVACMIGLTVVAGILLAVIFTSHGVNVPGRTGTGGTDVMWDPRMGAFILAR